jgi:hypothetical protein
MQFQTKIATCCYCGRRQTLRLTARAGHELACGSCGAPLHEMKWLKAPTGTAPTRPRKAASGYVPGVHGPERGQAPGHTPIQARYAAASDPRRRKKRKKPLWKRALGEAVDLIEDIFD